MYLPLTKVLTIYEYLCDSLEANKPRKFSVYTMKLGLDSDLEDAELKYAEDFYSICHIFNRKHGTDIKVDDLDVYKWIKQVRDGNLFFSGKIKVEVTLK